MGEALRVAVVTPHHSAPPEWLDQCIVSVKAQTHPCDHLIVCDGVPPPSRSDVLVLRTSSPHRDYGDTPRALGTITAFQMGYQAVAWLDDDNWYAPDHIQTLVRSLLEQQASVAASTRVIVGIDGAVLGPCEDVHPDRFIDTNCYLVGAEARWLANKWWMMPPEMHLLGDRVIFKAILTAGLRLAFTGKATVNYRTQFAFHYERFGIPVPPGARPNPYFAFREKYGREPAY